MHDPNLNRTESDLNAGFIFHSRIHPKPEKNPKPERKLKKPEKNSKKLKTRKSPERNKKNLKETHLQNPTGTRT
jgi:hypothetical protein